MDDRQKTDERQIKTEVKRSVYVCDKNENKL